MVDLLFVIIELFSLSFAVETFGIISGNLSKSAFIEGGWVALNADVRQNGASPTNHCWYKKTRVIVLSCGNHSALFGFVAKHACDGHNYDSQDSASISASHGKNRNLNHTPMCRKTI